MQVALDLILLIVQVALDLILLIVQVALDLILAKVAEDPQSGSCLNISYNEFQGPVANINPTGSPFANGGGGGGGGGGMGGGMGGGVGMGGPGTGTC